MQTNTCTNIYAHNFGTYFEVEGINIRDVIAQNLVWILQELQPSKHLTPSNLFH